MFNTIFTVALSVLLAVFMGVGLLRGRKYRWYYPLTRVILAIISAVSSFFLSELLANLLGTAGYDILMSYLPASITGYVNDVASAPEIFSALVTVILSPVFFLVLFFVLKAIMTLIAKNICITIAKKKALSKVTVEETVEIPTEAVEAEVTEVSTKKSKKTKVKKPKKVRRRDFIRAKGWNPAGMVCGMACGLIVFFVLMVPFVGVASVADEVMELVSKFVPNETVATVTEVTDAAATNPISKAVNTVGGKQMFNVLTTSKMGDHKLSLKNEIHFVTATGTAVHSTINNTVPREQAAADIREVSTAFSQSALIPTVAPDILSSANESWEKGESFHGIKKISIGGSAQPIVDALLEAVVQSNYDTIKSDADTLIEIAAILIEKDAINVAMSDPKSIPQNEDMTAPVLYELIENERFTPVVNAVAEFGIQYLGKQLHLHAHEDELYDEFTADAASKVSTVISSGSTDMLNTVYTELFDDYGLNVTAESIAALCEKTLAEYPDGNLEVSDVKSLLASTEFTFVNGEVIKLDSAKIVAEKSLLVCIDEITIDVSKISDKNKESKALASAVHEVFSIITLLNSGGFKDAQSIQKIGPILDALARTETIGDSGTGRLLTGILQSDMIHDQIGFSLIGATDVANTIFSKSHAQGYAPLLKSLSSTVEIVQSTTNLENLTKEELTSKVETLIEDLTPESAEVLQTMITPEVMISQKIPEQSAKPAADLMSNMLGNLAAAKDSGMSDEDFKKNADATSKLISMLSATSSSSSGLFGDTPTTTPDSGNDSGNEGGNEGDNAGDNDSGNEGGNVGDNAGENEGDSGATEEPAPNAGNSMTASDYINSVMESSVISQTIIEATYTEDGATEPVLDPLNLGKDLSENNKTEVIESLNSHWSNATEEEKQDPAYFQKYAAIGAFVNFPVTIGADGTIVPVVTAE